MAEVRLLNGRKIDWNNPPKFNQKCSWSKKTSNEKKIVGSFYVLGHFNRLNNLAQNKYGTEIEIFQGPFNTSVAASNGTHNLDACADWYIPGVSWYEQQRFFRAHGFACWYRHLPLFGNHIHGFTLPPHRGNNVSDDFKQAGLKVGLYVDGGVSTVGSLVASSQIQDYYNHAFGLSGQHEPNSDKSWFPRNIENTIFDLNAYIARRV